MRVSSVSVNYMMIIDKNKILNNLCYTELVYGRIRKKLSIQMTDKEIENYIFQAIEETPLEYFEKTGKNYYIRNLKRAIQITVNSHTTRIITADKIT